MISYYDITKLKELLKDFYNLTEIQITVFDEGFNVIYGYPEMQSNICRVIRSDPVALEQCLMCDRREIKTATEKRKAHTYRCHAGLTETISPIYIGNLTIGYLYLSHIFCYPSHECGWIEICELCKSYNLDFDALKLACFDAALIPAERIMSSANILNAVASYLCLERMVFLDKEDMVYRIDEYISKHLSEPLDISKICDYFHIGRTHLYKLSMQNYGTGIAAHIRNLRIEKAKNLLTGKADMPIIEIAEACGFADYNYFISLFKSKTGQSPKRYRYNYLKNANNMN